MAAITQPTLDHGLLEASDEAILAYALARACSIISADADFATMLALGRLRGPSLILLRSSDLLTPDQQAGLVLATYLHSSKTSKLAQ
jgi:predicted nuclease of predicted toxin-antitoxin system